MWSPHVARQPFMLARPILFVCPVYIVKVARYRAVAGLRQLFPFQRITE